MMIVFIASFPSLPSVAEVGGGIASVHGLRQKAFLARRQRRQQQGDDGKKGRKKKENEWPSMTGPGKEEEGKGRTKKNGVSSSLPTIATDQTASFWWWWWCAGEIRQISKELLFCTNSNFFSVKNKTKKNLKCGEFLSSPSLSYHLGELFRRQDNVLLPLARQKEKRRERGVEGGESGLLQMVLRGKKTSHLPLSLYSQCN